MQRRKKYHAILAALLSLALPLSFVACDGLSALSSSASVQAQSIAGSSVTTTSTTTSTTSTTTTLAAVAASTGKITLGAYSTSFEQDPTWYITNSQPTPLQVYANLVGRSPHLVMWFQDWVNQQMNFDAALMNSSSTNGATIMITWEPHDWNGAVNQPDFSLASIIRGDHDTYIHTFAKASAQWNHTFLIRLMHEMNGSWNSWSENINGNTPALYVQAWRHIVDIFRAENATNVKWAWVPNIDQGGMTTMVQFYPGDAYVDWIGLDGYNSGTSQTWSKWTSLKDLFLSSYQQITAITSKPMMIAEIGCAEQGGDKAAWITQGFHVDLPTSMPLIQAVVWFNLNKEANWTVNSSPAAFTAFEAVVNSITYAKTFTPY